LSLYQSAIGYTHTHLCVHTYTDGRAHARTQTCMCAYRHTHVCLHTDTHTHAHISIHADVSHIHDQYTTKCRGKTAISKEQFVIPSSQVVEL